MDLKELNLDVPIDGHNDLRRAFIALGGFRGPAWRSGIVVRLGSARRRKVVPWAMSLASSGTEHAPESGAGAERMNQMTAGATSCAPAAIGASPLVAGSIKISRTIANREHAGERRARGRAICVEHAGAMGARGEGSVVRRVRASTSILFHSAALALSHAKAQAAGGPRERFLRTTVAKDDRHSASASAELSER
jgi:hypothetical protein